MRCLKQPDFLRGKPTKIENLWEVKIDPKVWKSIVHYAKKYNFTYSWVVRYCVFRLVRKQDLRMMPAMEKLSRELKENQPPSKECHRHILCLYGEDETLLRMAAMKLKITVSHLVRLALSMYLRNFSHTEKYIAFRKNHYLLQEYYSIKREFKNDSKKLRTNLGDFYQSVIGCRLPRAMDFHSMFWYGIKLTKSVTHNLTLNSRLPGKVQLCYTRFSKSDWFNIRLKGAPPGYPFG